MVLWMFAWVTAGSMTPGVSVGFCTQRPARGANFGAAVCGGDVWSGAVVVESSGSVTADADTVVPVAPLAAPVEDDVVVPGAMVSAAGGAAVPLADAGDRLLRAPVLHAHNANSAVARSAARTGREEGARGSRTV